MGGVPFPLRDRLGEPVDELDRAVGPPLETDPAERVPEHRESGPRPRFLAVQGEVDLDGGRGAGQPLGEDVRDPAQVVRVGGADAGQPEAVTGVLSGPARPRVGGPRPLAAEASAGEVVVGGGRGGRLRRQPGLLVLGDGGAVVPDHRPAVRAPAHRLEVHDPAVGALVLEVQEPVLAGRGAHPGALVRPVDVGVLLLQDDAFLVGPEEAA